MKNFNKLAKKLVRELGDTPKKIMEDGRTALEQAREALRPLRDKEMKRRHG